MAQHLSEKAGEPVRRSTVSRIGTEHEAEQNKERAAWIERVARAILEEGAYLTPPRPHDVSARLIAYFASRPDRRFEIAIYEERVRIFRCRATPRAAGSGRHDG